MKKAMLDPVASRKPKESSAKGTSESTSTEQAQVSVQSLTVGTTLPSDLYDQNQVLLLSKGSTITRRFIEAILLRGITEVQTSSESAKIIRGEASNEATLDLSTVQPATEIETATTRHLDSAVDQQAMPDINTLARDRTNIAPIGGQGIS